MIIIHAYMEAILKMHMCISITGAGESSPGLPLDQTYFKVSIISIPFSALYMQSKKTHYPNPWKIRFPNVIAVGIDAHIIQLGEEIIHCVPELTCLLELHP